MARGTQLQELVSMLRAECGHSVLVSAGIDNLPALKQKLKRAQVMLYDDYDWPFMRIMASKALAAGQRYYDFPTGVVLEGVEEVAVVYNGQPEEVERGIDFEEYAQYNSDSGDQADPALRWDVRRTTAAAEQVEVWPIPASNSMVLWFKAKKNLRALVSDTDVADLDDFLIVLTAAHEILSRQKDADADKVRDAAAARLKQLKVRVKGGSKPFSIGGGGSSKNQRGRSIIRVSSNTN